MQRAGVTGGSSQKPNKVHSPKAKSSALYPDCIFGYFWPATQVSVSVYSCLSQTRDLEEIRKQFSYAGLKL